MKKLITVSLAALMALGLFAACSGTTTTDNTTTTTAPSTTTATTTKATTAATTVVTTTMPTVPNDTLDSTGPSSQAKMPNMPRMR